MNADGLVTQATDAATGTITASYRYDSFGGRTQAGTLAQRYGFTGREADAESGLIYFRARTYDPALGQFIQRDPIGFAAGDLNLYAYVWNDPYNWSDPSGLNAGVLTHTNRKRQENKSRRYAASGKWVF